MNKKYWLQALRYYQRKIQFLALTCIFFNAAPLSAADFKVIYPKAESEHDPRQAYFTELLKMALEGTRQTHGEYQLDIYSDDIPSGRIPMFIVKNQLINIMSSPVTKQLNDGMQAIPFPLLMGIQGIRIALLHNDNRSVLEKSGTLKDMRKIIFGFGLGWIDGQIFQDANLRAETAVNYENLFAMLSNQRIDAFPRGANEILLELKSFSQLYGNLTLDEHTIFYYPLPVYFYVAKESQLLATRLLKGLTNAANDGSFKKLFDQHYADDLAQLNLNKRRVFILPNRYLPENTESEVANFLHPFIKNNILSKQVLLPSAVK